MAFVLFITVFIFLTLKSEVFYIYFYQGESDVSYIAGSFFSITSKLILLCGLLKFSSFLPYIFEIYVSFFLFLWSIVFFLAPFFIKHQSTVKGYILSLCLFATAVPICLIFFFYSQEIPIIGKFYFFLLIFFYLVLLIFFLFDLILVYQKEFLISKDFSKFVLILCMQFIFFFTIILIFKQITNSLVFFVLLHFVFYFLVYSFYKLF